MNGGTALLLPGYRIKILDGNHLPGSEHRIKELRTMGAAALPGHTLVVHDSQLMLRHRRLPRRGWPCTGAFAVGASRGDRPAQGSLDRRPQFLHHGLLVRDCPPGRLLPVCEHAATLTYTLVGKRKDRGRVESGRVFEQTLRATNDAGEVLFLRRVTVVLDKPTRDGDTGLHLLTNVPVKHARARVVADLYRRRLDDRDCIRRDGKGAQRRDQRAGLSQSSVV